ncbi:hypothetical protein [Anaerolentibacter hominis]|uniref:hypothetical protein n=1 Tax=Anaerolentibacter hominis TaxID=3079009 RepID=UPI0031B83C3D
MTENKEKSKVTLACCYDSKAAVCLLHTLEFDGNNYLLTVRQTDQTLRHSYSSLLKLFDQGVGTTYYVLSDNSDLTFREFYRNLWLPPAERIENFRLVLFTGESNGEESPRPELLSTPGWPDLDEYLMAESIDPLPVYPYDRTVYDDRADILGKADGCAVVRGGYYLAGKELWENFEASVNRGLTSRIRLICLDSSQTVITDLCFTGEYFDVIDEEIKWQSDFRYLLIYNPLSSYLNDRTYFLSVKADWTPEDDSTVLPGKFSNDWGHSLLKLFRVVE